MCSPFFFFLSLKYSQVTKLPLGIKPRIKTSIKQGLNAPLIKTVVRQDEGFPKSVSKHLSATVLNKNQFERDRNSISPRDGCAEASSEGAVDRSSIPRDPHRHSFPTPRPRDAKGKIREQQEGGKGKSWLELHILRRLDQYVFSEKPEPRRKKTVVELSCELRVPEN